jgi:hypothetical protein
VFFFFASFVPCWLSEFIIQLLVSWRSEELRLRLSQYMDATSKAFPAEWKVRFNTPRSAQSGWMTLNCQTSVISSKPIVRWVAFAFSLMHFAEHLERLYSNVFRLVASTKDLKIDADL